MSDEYVAYMGWGISAQEQIDGFRNEVRELKDGNAKLRELVRIAVQYCDSGTCDGCPIQGENGSCPYSDMARDLGVEVDG